MSGLDPLIHVPDDPPLLEYYRGTFDSVFIALHPFFTIPGVHPLDCEYGTLVFRRSEMPDGVDLMPYLDAARSQTRRQKKIAWEEVEAKIAAQGQSISWDWMVRALHFADHRLLDCALRTKIGGLRSELADEAAADRLTAFCNAQGIFLPTEGNFQSIMRDALVDLFRQAGAESVILGDEFGEVEQEVALDELPPDLSAVIPYGSKRIRDPQASLLAIVPWDHFLTVIAMTKDCRDRVDPARTMEGFWAEPFTTIGWLVEPLVPIARST